MAVPPRDAKGLVAPHDDPDIDDADGLLRRIDPDNHVVWDKNLGCHRLSSGAFSESSTPNGGMSVELEKLMQTAGHDPLSGLSAGWGLVRLIAGELRKMNCLVGSNPLPENPYHGEVWNPNRKGGKIKVRENYTWVKKADRIS